MTFRCLLLRERELHRRNNKLAVVKCAEGNIVHVPPNRDVVIQGYTHHELLYHAVWGMLQPNDRAAILSDLDIAPLLLSYKYGSNRLIRNIATRTIVVSPNAILCEVQPVSIADIEINKDVAHEVPDDVNLTSDLFSEEQPEQGSNNKTLVHLYIYWTHRCCSPQS